MTIRLAGDGPLKQLKTSFVCTMHRGAGRHLPAPYMHQWLSGGPFFRDPLNRFSLDTGFPKQDFS